MSRTTRRRAVRAVAPVAGLLAAGLLVWQGSYAAFTATSTNQGDSWAAGKLVLKNNGTGGSTFTATTATPLINASNLVPGAAAVTQCITVESSGSLAGTLKFYRGALTDVPTVTTPVAFNLSDAITVKVDAAPLTLATDIVDPSCVAGSGTVAFPALSTPIAPAGTALSALPTAPGATSVPVGTGVVRVAYRFTWAFPSTANDNNYQGATTKANLNWEIS